ncbi:MAG: hypothetical protein AB7F79_10925 [Steroidobacteraceae bacterium]
MLAFGGYPDPSGTRQAEKVARSNTFEAVACEWLVLQEKQLAAATYDKITAAEVLKVLAH